MSTSTIFNDLRIFMAQQLIESVSEPLPNTKIYLTYGKCDAWENENSPPDSNCSISTVYEVWDNMIGAKRILGGDFHHVIPRYDWTNNTTYFAYTHLENGLCDQELPFYVMNSEYSVYKCLANNRGNTSISEPKSTLPGVTTTTSDGYIWKYMYTIPDSERLRFTTSNYIPVKTLFEDDGSLQWQVQDLAVDGAIHYIEIVDGGSGYTSNSNVSITLTGDGTGFSGIAVLSDSSINRVEIQNVGKNYTYANITITDDGGTPTTEAVLRPIISPPGGHGSDPLYELYGKNVMVDGRFKYDEEGILPTTNDYRQIAIIKDPYLLGTSNVASISAGLQATKILCGSSVGNFLQDEMIFQGNTLETATFKGRVLQWQPSPINELKLINTDGIAVPQQQIVGNESAIVKRVANTVSKGVFEQYSGKILYVDNIKPVSRSSDQIENFKIVLKF